MNVIFKLSLATLITVALASFTVLMYLVFADDTAYNKYLIAERASLIVIPVAFISLMFTTYTCDKGRDSML